MHQSSLAAAFGAHPPEEADGFEDELVAGDALGDFDDEFGSPLGSATFADGDPAATNGCQGHSAAKTAPIAAPDSSQPTPVPRPAAAGGAPVGSVGSAPRSIADTNRGAVPYPPPLSPGGPSIGGPRSPYIGPSAASGSAIGSAPASPGYGASPYAQGPPGGPSASGAGVRYKTEMCRNFAMQGNCPFGNQCHFAHGEVERRNAPGAPPQTGSYCEGTAAVPVVGGRIGGTSGIGGSIGSGSIGAALSGSAPPGAYGPGSAPPPPGSIGIGSAVGGASLGGATIDDGGRMGKVMAAPPPRPSFLAGRSPASGSAPSKPATGGIGGALGGTSAPAGASPPIPLASAGGSAAVPVGSVGSCGPTGSLGGADRQSASMRSAGGGRFIHDPYGSGSCPKPAPATDAGGSSV